MDLKKPYNQITMEQKNITTVEKKTGYPTTYNGIWTLFCQPREKGPIGCGYYYIVTCGAMSHTAFATRRALKIWLKQTGLKLGNRGYNRTISLKGSYTVNLEMLNQPEFNAKYRHLPTFYALDNGDYTIGYIEERENGNILHVQNCNMDRPILDHQATNRYLNVGTWRTY